MIDHARHNLGELTNVEFQLLNGYDLSAFASDSLDVVYCTGVFMHLDEWDRFGYVAEAYRVLRSGGRIYFNNIDALTDKGWAMFTEIARLDPAMRPANVSKTSTPQELENYARRSGFTDIRVHLAPLLVTVDAVKP
jgi:SAM-dependent methyltransferase